MRHSTTTCRRTATYCLATLSRRHVSVPLQPLLLRFLLSHCNSACCGREHGHGQSGHSDSDDNKRGHDVRVCPLATAVTPPGLRRSICHYCLAASAAAALTAAVVPSSVVAYPQSSRHSVRCRPQQAARPRRANRRTSARKCRETRTRPPLQMPRPPPRDLVGVWDGRDVPRRIVWR